MNAKWTGNLPRIGDYLMSRVRPRFAYRITAIEKDNIVEWDSAAKATRYKVALTVEKVKLSDVPDTAIVHPWKWDTRGAKKVMEVRHGG